MKKILLDCDDVILNWINKFKDFAVNDCGFSPVTDLPETWELNRWLNCNKDEAYAAVSYFNEKSPKFGSLEPYPGAVNAIEEFIEDGFRISIITSCSNDENCVSRRKENLKNVFGDVFEDIHCLPLGVKKSDYLKKYENAFWVEDNYHNAVMGLEHGHHSIVLRRSHNLGFEKVSHPDVVWKNTWNETKEHIFDMKTLSYKM
jgi:FMN phosphatase YigB (HAD superfamily)